MDKRLEERYVVIKLSRLDEKQLLRLNELLNVSGPDGMGLASAMVDCVVVEEDWPEYKPTVDAIITRSIRENLPPMPEGYMPWDDPDTYGPS